MTAIKMAYFEKQRSPFFVTLCLVMGLIVVLMIPRSGNIVRALVIEPTIFRQADNATWVSVGVGIATGFFLPLIGAIFVRDAIEMDRQNGTLSFLKITGMSKATYVISKFLANFLLLTSLLGVIVSVALIGLVFKYGGAQFSLWQFFAPFLVILPGLTFISALSLLTETIPWLQGKLGTLLVSIGLLGGYITGTNYMVKPSWLVRVFNFSGSEYLIENIRQSVSLAGVKKLETVRVISSAHKIGAGHRSLILIPMRLTSSDWFSLLALVLISLGIVMVTIAIFNFNSVASKRSMVGKTNQASHFQRRLFNRLAQIPSDTGRRLLEKAWQLAQLLHPIALWVLLGLWAVSWVVATSILAHVIFPVMYLLALPIFANGGTLEINHAVYDWLGTTDKGQMRWLWATLIDSIGFSVVLMLPLSVRTTGVVAACLIIWAVQLPLLSLAISFVTENSALIQVGLVIFMYLYLNGAPILPNNGGSPLILAIIYGSVGIVSCLILREPIK